MSSRTLLQQVITAAVFSFTPVIATIASEVALNPEFANQGQLTIDITDESAPQTRMTFKEAVPLSDGGFLLAFNEEFPRTFFGGEIRWQSLSVKLLKVTATGEVDSLYGEAGIQTLPIEYRDELKGLKTLSDGKFMLVVESLVNHCSVVMAIWRLNSDGSIDQSFASNGKTTEHFGGNYICNGYDYSSYFVTDEVAVTENDELLTLISSPRGFNSSANIGKISVLVNNNGELTSSDESLCDAMTNTGSDTDMVCAGELDRDSTNVEYVFRRFNASVPDNDEAFTVLNFRELLDGTIQNEGMWFSSLDMDGTSNGEVYSLLRIIQQDVIDGQWQHVFNQRVLVKLTPENNLDPDTFTGGILTDNDLPILAQSQQMAPVSEGHLLLMGTGFITKVAADGTTDSRYGDNGTFNYNSDGYSKENWLIDKQNEQVFVVQANDDTVSITSVNEQGLLNNDFGNSGTFTIDLSPANQSIRHYSPLTVNSVRTAGSNNNDLRVDLQNQNAEFTAAINNIGERDTKYGIDGILEKDVSEEGERKKVLTLADGSWLVLTSSGLYKYNSDGLLDTQFAISGAYLTDMDYQDVLIFDNGNILLAGDGAELSFHMLRLTSDGQTDTEFAENGQKSVQLGADGLGIFAADDVPASAEQRTAYKRNVISRKHLYGSVVAGNSIDWHFYGIESQIGTYFGNCHYKVRFDVNGDLLTDFASGGVARLCNEDGDQIYPPALVPVAQYSVNDNVVQVIAVDYDDQDVFRWRTYAYIIVILDASGIETRRVTHGLWGITRNEFSNAYNYDFLGSSIQPDGKILTAIQSGENPYKLAINRFNSDGSLDQNFAASGVYLLPTDERNYIDYQHFAMTPGGQMYLSGQLNGEAVVQNLEEQNLAPVIQAEAATLLEIAEDTSSAEITWQADDGNGDGLQWLLAQAPAKGTVDMNSVGEQLRFTYTPAPDVNGVDSLTFSVSDWRGGEQSQTVEISITPVNDAPILSLSDVATEADSESEISITAQISDVDGDNLTLTWEQEAGPTINIQSDSENTLVFETPEVTADTEIVIKASVSDGTEEVSQSLTLTVLAPAPQPDPVQPAEQQASSGGSVSPVVLFLMLLSGVLFKGSRRINK